MTLSQDTLTPIEVAHARTLDPMESHLAAAGVDVTKTQKLVLAALIPGAATDHELVLRIKDYWPEAKVTPQSVRSRRSELVSKGLVEPDGTTGPSEFGGVSRKHRLAR